MGSRLLRGLSLLACLVTGCAPTLPHPSTGTIRGTLRLPAVSATTAMPAAAHLHGGPRKETPEDAVVYLDALPAPPAASAPPAKRSAERRDASEWMFTPRAAQTAAAHSSATRSHRARAAARASRGAAKATPAKGGATASRAPARSDRATAAGARRDGDPAPEPAEVAAAPAITQVDHHFVPRVLPVAVGATVRFENRDRVYHNVFSVSPAKRFDVGKYAPRQSRQVSFDKPGVVPLYCDIDPAMAGFVFVAPTPLYTQPDAGGGFVLPDLPCGTYTLRVWHPTLGQLVRKVIVPAQGEAVVTLQL